MNPAFVVAGSVAVVLTAAAAFTDSRTGHIPNWLTLPPVLLAPICHGLFEGTFPLVWSCIGVVLCGALPLLMFRSGGMGGGDVKLFAALGGVLGPGMGLEVQLASMVVGATYSIGKVALQGRLLGLLRNTAAVTANLFLPEAKRMAVETSERDMLRLGFSIFVGTTAVIAWHGVTGR